MVLGFNSVKECRLYSKRFLGILRRTSSFIVMKPLKNDELKIVNIELYTLEYKKNGITELHNSVYWNILLKYKATCYLGLLLIV